MCVCMGGVGGGGGYIQGDYILCPIVNRTIMRSRSERARVTSIRITLILSSERVIHKLLSPNKHTD